MGDDFKQARVEYSYTFWIHSMRLDVRRSFDVRRALGRRY